MWYICTIELYSAVENTIRASAGKWMELEVNMLSEISQIEKRQKLYVFSHAESRFLCESVHVYDVFVRHGSKKMTLKEGKDLKGGEERATEFLWPGSKRGLSGRKRPSRVGLGGWVEAVGEMNRN